MPPLAAIFRQHSNYSRLTNDRQKLRHTWESLRADIEGIIEDKKISVNDFRSLRNHENWKTIEENIYHTFCKLDHMTERPIWLWEFFKLDTSCIVVEEPYKLLDRLVENDETVWFFVNGDKEKLWFYEGKVPAIITVIKESSYIDELYLASKKYQWLICINHHDDLVATGEIMPDKLRRLK
jgi:hypothetical protein